MGGRSPDQFRLSRLKEGERVCGGRGQFGKESLWNSNAFSKLWMKLIKGGVLNLMSLATSAEAQMPRSQPRQCA